MEDYNKIIKKVNKAMKEMRGKDKTLQEIAFKTLLEDALNNRREPSANQDSLRVNTLPKKALKTGTKRRPTTPSPARYKESSIRNEVKEVFVDIDPSRVEGVVPLDSIKQKWQMYLWVLAVARTKGLDLLTNGEIAYVLYERFTHDVSEKRVNNLTFKAKEGYVAKDEVDGLRAWKLLGKGIDLMSTDKKEVENSEG